jgi:hypothetical protein
MMFPCGVKDGQKIYCKNPERGTLPERLKWGAGRTTYSRGFEISAVGSGFRGVAE